MEETAVYGIRSLSEIVTLLNNPDRFEEKRQLISEEDRKRNENNLKAALDFSELYGQERMKRAAMVAAAGLHNLHRHTRLRQKHGGQANSDHPSANDIS